MATRWIYVTHDQIEALDAWLDRIADMKGGGQPATLDEPSRHLQ
jgi:ABC-type Fe3+/spermidine/putrescine transport system ATPase subunit